MARKPTQPACPVCGYDQSSLIDSWTDACPVYGVCSECGSALDWREVNNPTLFEQRRYCEHPASGLLRGPKTTARRSLRPGSLWAWVPRTQPLSFRRLLATSCLGIWSALLIALLVIPAMGLVGAYLLYYNAPIVPGYGRSIYYDPPAFASNYLQTHVFVGDMVWIVVMAFHAITVLVAGIWALWARHRRVRLVHIIRVALLMPIPLSVFFVVDSMFATAEALYLYESHYLGGSALEWLATLLDLAYTYTFIATATIFTLAWFWHAWVMFMTRYLRAARPRLTVLVYGLISLLLLPLVMGLIVSIIG